MSQFFRSAGRCGVMRRGVHVGMPLCTLPCPIPASLDQITSFSKRTLIFWEISQNLCVSKGSQGHGMQQPRPRHVAKAKAAPHGHAAAKANAQGLGSPMGMLPRPRYAAKAKARACSTKGLGRPPWALCQRPRRAAKAKAAPQGHAAAKA